MSEVTEGIAKKSLLLMADFNPEAFTCHTENSPYLGPVPCQPCVGFISLLVWFKARPGPDVIPRGLVAAWGDWSGSWL